MNVPGEESPILVKSLGGTAGFHTSSRLIRACRVGVITLRGRELEDCGLVSGLQTCGTLIFLSRRLYRTQDRCAGVAQPQRGFL
jgi:hypothetical protein